MTENVVIPSPPGTGRGGSFGRRSTRTMRAPRGLDTETRERDRISPLAGIRPPARADPTPDLDPTPKLGPPFLNVQIRPGRTDTRRPAAPPPVFPSLPSFADHDPQPYVPTPNSGRAGVPMEVMGLMLGQFVDDYTVKVVDVFAMPQSGTGVSVEAVDPVFQTKMLEMLKQTGREEMVVGWYHSHPGFGCWLSGVDINTQQAFEALNPRLVSIVIDPVQSVKGKVVIDAFRLINPQTIMLGQEPRQTTSNLGHLNKPSIQALIHGLNRHYYSINISYRKNQLEEKMLLNLNKNKWSEGLRLKDFDKHGDANEKVVLELKGLADRYEKAVVEEDKLTAKELMVKNVGRQDAKKHLTENVRKLMSDNIVQTLGAMLDTICF